MTMTKIYCAALISLLLVGCHAGPAKYTLAENANQACNFGNIPGKSFKINGKMAPYITNQFFFDPSSLKYSQRDSQHYFSLTSQKFKVLETGIVTEEDTNSRKYSSDRYRYEEEQIGTELYKRDRAYSTKLVTEDCSIYYLSGNSIKSQFAFAILNPDGTDINDKDILALIGTAPLQVLELDTKVSFDKFEKIYKVSTPFFEDILIRGAVSGKTNDIVNVQLYANLTFFDDWGHIRDSVDTDGNHHEVTKISTDTDCSSKYSGCRLTETVGIALTQEFLSKNKDGFEIKAFGTRDKVISVPGKLIKSFLSGLEKARNDVAVNK